mmetsp:Transcript_12375/g.28193  ORF Transcript_12375/g.28193 Transcript_12375/m.28193 type:complete len:393 (+) Transcript_12375:30-1208(+)
MSASVDMVDVCVLGAGLSGALVANRLVAQGRTVTVIEARNRIGGRLLNARHGGDLGGAWVWPSSEPSIMQILNEFGVGTIPQHYNGETMARISSGQRQVLPPGQAERYAACGPGASRIVGGAEGLVRKLLSDSESVALDTRVTRVRYSSDGVALYGESGEDVSFRCRAAVLAAPPRVLATSIEFEPSLPKPKYESMIATDTWMQDFGKISVSFPENWWRDLNMSAISIDQAGAVQTWWEACSGDGQDGNRATLAGFVTEMGAHMLKKIGDAERLLEYVVDALGALYAVDRTVMGFSASDGLEASGEAENEGLVVSKSGITVTYKSWLDDRYTNRSSECGDVDFATDYGDRLLRQSVGPLFFAGCETERGSGHMDSAIVSAERVFQEVNTFLI